MRRFDVFEKELKAVSGPWSEHMDAVRRCLAELSMLDDLSQFAGLPDELVASLQSGKTIAQQALQACCDLDVRAGDNVEAAKYFHDLLKCLPKPAKMVTTLVGMVSVPSRKLQEDQEEERNAEARATSEMQSRLKQLGQGSECKMLAAAQALVDRQEQALALTAAAWKREGREATHFEVVNVTDVTNEASTKLVKVAVALGDGVRQGMSSAAKLPSEHTGQD